MAKKYPLTYEEYEKKVTELLLNNYKDEELETIITKLDEFLKVNPDFIKGLYNNDCFSYDHPEIFGDNTKKITFSESHIISTAVHNLKMILEGEELTG